MGTGKTLMCLALILSTIHQPTQPPPHELNISPIVTQEMLDTYPYPDIQTIRDQSSQEAIEGDLKLPSLSQLCGNLLACRDQSTGQAFSLLDNRLSTSIRQDTFYLQYPPDTSWMRNARAATVRRTAEKVYLGNTTLVIVPPILVDQWEQEIDKHIEHGALRVLRVGAEDLPGVVELLRYDVRLSRCLDVVTPADLQIILMDVKSELFGSTREKLPLTTLGFGQEDTVTRARMDLPPSNLLKVRWKRVILGKFQSGELD